MYFQMYVRFMQFESYTSEHYVLVVGPTWDSSISICRNCHENVSKLLSDELINRLVNIDENYHCVIDTNGN